MKSLVQFIKEDIFATPNNTMGMGNPSAPTDTTPGSGDIPQSNINIKSNKKKKKIKIIKK